MQQSPSSSIAPDRSPTYTRPPPSAFEGRRDDNRSPSVNSVSPHQSRVASPSSLAVANDQANGGLSIVVPPNLSPHPEARRAPSLPDPSPAHARASASSQSSYSPLSMSPGEVLPPSRTSSFGPQPHERLSRAGPSNVQRTGSSSPAGQQGPPASFSPQKFQQQMVNQQVRPPPQLPNFPNNQQRPYGLSSGPSPQSPQRPPSEPLHLNNVRKSPSTRSLSSHYEQQAPPPPPIPSFPPNGYASHNNNGFNPQRNNSHGNGNLHAPQPRTLIPHAQFRPSEPSFIEPSPPNSPVEETKAPIGPVTSSVSAQMKCKVFLKQHHAQWKSLGSAKLKLYRQDPTNIKQLVVETDNKDSSVLISTIVLTDGVERVGKTGVAIELSNNGARTGIVYMIQLRNEKSAGGLFESLLAGSDRAA